MSRCRHTEIWYARRWQHDRRAGQVTQCVKPDGHDGPHFCERIQVAPPEPRAFVAPVKAYDLARLTADVRELRSRVAGSVEKCTVPMPTDGPGLEEERARLRMAISTGGLVLHYARQRLTAPVEVAS